MGKISQKTRKKNYYKIFEQIHECPTLPVQDIALNTKLARNTVSKYLKEMYARSIIVGPHIRINPAENYTEYVYLMNFQDPWKVFNGLKQFPHVVYHAIAFGDWNTMVITDRFLDFSALAGFLNTVYQGARGYSHTPHVEYMRWDESFKRIRKQMKVPPPLPESKTWRLAPFLDWGEDEWKLFHVFKYDMRQNVTPVLRKIKVRYQPYSEWMNTLKDHCTVHTGFYPEGYKTYVSYCFLFSSPSKSIESLFSFFPTTSFFIELHNHILVFTATSFPDVTRLFCIIYHMKARHMIKAVNYTAPLFYCQH